jgi:hypothetical protein
MSSTWKREIQNTGRAYLLRKWSEVDCLAGKQERDSSTIVENKGKASSIIVENN